MLQVEEEGQARCNCRSTYALLLVKLFILKMLPYKTIWIISRIQTDYYRLMIMIIIIINFYKGLIIWAVTSSFGSSSSYSSFCFFLHKHICCFLPFLPHCKYLQTTSKRGSFSSISKRLVSEVHSHLKCLNWLWHPAKYFDYTTCSVYGIFWHDNGGALQFQFNGSELE